MWQWHMQDKPQILSDKPYQMSVKPLCTSVANTQIGQVTCNSNCEYYVHHLTVGTMVIQVRISNKGSPKLNQSLVLQNINATDVFQRP
jgi:hypothetical protein